MRSDRVTGGSRPSGRSRQSASVNPGNQPLGPGHIVAIPVPQTRQKDVFFYADAIEQRHYRRNGQRDQTQEVAEAQCGA